MCGDAARWRYGDRACSRVAHVGDVEVAAGVEGQAAGTAQPGNVRGADQTARRVVLAHRGAIVVGDVEVAAGVEHQRLMGELDRAGRRDVVEIDDALGGLLGLLPTLAVEAMLLVGAAQGDVRPRDVAVDDQGARAEAGGVSEKGQRGRAAAADYSGFLAIKPPSGCRRPARSTLPPPTPVRPALTLMAFDVSEIAPLSRTAPVMFTWSPAVVPVFTVIGAAAHQPPVPVRLKTFVPMPRRRRWTRHPCWEW